VLCKAFPDKSRFHQIAHVESDGYSALNMIFGENHPRLDPISLSFTDTSSKQRKDQNIYQFWMQYQEYLHLKSWVEDIKKNLNTEDQVDLSITKYYNIAYLRPESTTDQRSDPNAFQTRYTATRLPTVPLFNISIPLIIAIDPFNQLDSDNPKSPPDEPKTTAYNRSGPSYC
jgi:hypothetical protein